MKFEVKNPFYKAIEKGHIRTVRRLLRGGLFRKPVDPNKIIPKPERTDIILSADARENVTPLGVAINSGRLEIVRLLVEAGADVNTNTSDTWSTSPLRQAARNGNIEIAMYLLEAGADAKERFTLRDASYHGSVELAERLISKGADLDEGNMFSESIPMQGAVLGRCLRVAELLISKGAKVDAHSMSDILMLAVKMKQSEMVSLLFNQILGDKPWARDTIVRDALSEAIRCSIRGIFYKDKISTERCSADDWLDILEFLTKHGGGVLRCGIEKKEIQSEFDIYRQPEQAIPAWVSEKAKTDAKIDEYWEIYKVCGWPAQKDSKQEAVISTLGYKEAILLPLTFLNYTSKVLKTFYIIAYFNTHSRYRADISEPLLHFSVIEDK